jgi:hypothetical protein
MNERFRQAVRQARAAFKLVRETSRDPVVLKREGARAYTVSPDERPDSQPGTRVPAAVKQHS